MANANGKAIHLEITETDLNLIRNNLRFAQKMLKLANNQLDPDKNDQELQLSLAVLITQAYDSLTDAIVLGDKPCTIGEM
ncbi:hypothetical protein NFK84_24545 (plasmid) [Enterobacter ludwigii]|uniref:hypothetical protein n=1 Tax=Enterobacter ludwigii TaxID=299767 RepID=UPI00242C0B7D|nr:hypothetical protein [Enterobacter ludwigii]WGA07190.1 hypothetical protein NFK84_24545 [Enterobacter ludwigii]